jgi:hypothetical protein
MADEQPGMKELLQALAQVGRIAEAMLAQREAVTQQPTATAAAELVAEFRLEEREEHEGHPDDAPGATNSTGARPPDASPSSRPSEWRDSMPPTPRQFFTKHAAERLHERYGVPFANTVATMAALSHQIRGTHFAGIEGVNLGQRPPSDGVNGTMWAVDIFREVGFVVVDDDGVIVTALPRDTKQLTQIHGAQRAALEAFRTELQLRHAAPVSLLKHQGRGSSHG